jgi:hypothetical protein
MDLALFGFVIAAIGLAAGIVFGSIQLFKTRQLGDDVAKDLRTLGEQTLKAIEKNGSETRSTIASVHKSIKAELK